MLRLLKSYFSPEFRNRLDAIIPFAPLGQDVIRLVVDKFIMQLDAQLAERNVEIELSEAARDWLAKRGYDRNYGARPLTRVVQEHIKKPLADQLLFGELTGGGLALVDVENDALVVTVKTPPQRRFPASAPPCPPPSAARLVADKPRQSGVLPRLNGLAMVMWLASSSMPRSSAVKKRATACLKPEWAIQCTDQVFTGR